MAISLAWNGLFQTFQSLKLTVFFFSIHPGINPKLGLTNVNMIAFSNFKCIAFCIVLGMANQLYSLTAYITINRSPSSVLGHPPLLVLDHIFLVK